MPVGRAIQLVCLAAAGAALTAIAHSQPPAPADAAGLEFFEKRIRPILAENCYSCHGEKKQKANLRLDRSATILKGGGRGPAVAARNPDGSPLIQAIRYTDESFQMPPKGKLKEEHIADLTAWVKMGAPLPVDRVAAPAAAKPESSFSMEERLRHWCYQPVRSQAPPKVEHPQWPTSPIDHFILARLEAEGLSPAAPASKRALLRRITFDLTGLPPTPDAIRAFLADDSPTAFETVVDRLLASPHYGERWGRHWLDLVRYAETLGHEFDFDIFNAWRYRDYVIRALNDDVPFDQFAIEHLAGDLLPEPRRHAVEGFNESIIGTGFFWLGEGKQAPVDVRQEQADRMDNQIDVLGKVFLAQTLSCARCHDHKFDAIPTKDYYSLAGYLRSSRFQQAQIDGPERIAATLPRLAAIKQRIRTSLIASLAAQVGSLDRYLLGALRVETSSHGASDAVAQIANQLDLDAARLERWVRTLKSEAARSWQRPLYLMTQITNPDELPLNWPEIPKQKINNAESAAAAALAGSEVFARFDGLTYSGWDVGGVAFGAGPSRTGDLVLHSADNGSSFVPHIIESGWAHSGLISTRLEGELLSRTFTIDKKYMHFLVGGKESRINIVVDGFNLIRDPIYGGLTIELGDGKVGWRAVDVGMWKGHRAYVEVLDSTTPDPSRNPLPAFVAGRPGNGYVQLKEIRFSDHPALPPAPHAISNYLLQGSPAKNPAELARRCRDLIAHHLAKWQAASPEATPEGDAIADLVNWLLEEKLLDVELPKEELAEFRLVESSVPAPRRAPAMASGTAEDEYVFLRGNYKTPGETAPRHPPAVVGGDTASATANGADRLRLARQIVGPSDPLAARVIVNRLWQHHFGAGLVRTPDDFGRMGESPTHPELLDYLACELIRNGWSLKHMHRLLVLTSTYRMASHGDSRADMLDPQNKWLHRMPIQRLEAEAIRDAILLLSGKLDRRVGGPPVAPYLTPFMEGRGRPATSGPLDGAGRRSIYLGVRRNFLAPLFLAFDYPTPFTAIGRRTISNVPAQALTLMNDPYVIQQANAWAKRLLDASEVSENERIAAAYEAAFARLPSAEESDAALAFLRSQEKQYRGDRQHAWADLCHVLLNVKEFIFVQ